MPERRPQRLAALRVILEGEHLDGLLLTSEANIRYLTGFSGSSALVVLTAKDILVVTDFRYSTQVREEVGDLAQVVIDQQSLWNSLWRRLPELGDLEMLGFESAHLAHRDFERLLDGGARWHWRPTVDVVEQLREGKDADELALIENAVKLAERALERTVERISCGHTELQVAGALESALRAEGSEGFPFATIVATGPRSALPHARSSDREIGRGDLVLIDFGAIVKGYCSDITRTFVMGSADDMQRELYSIVRGANELASGSIRSGMTGRDADALARSYIEERGHGDEFGHSLGHGIGLEVHEAPRLAKTAEAVLRRGSVVTIEPGVYREGWGGIRIEDDVVLEADGRASRCLSSFAHDLLEIE